MTDPITNLNRLMQQLRLHQTEIISFEAGDPEENPWVQGSPAIVKGLQVVPFDPKWLQTFAIWENRIQQALGKKSTLYFTCWFNGRSRFSGKTDYRH